MRLEQFQYVVEIARCKSMSKASKKLYITQPSLSTAIQNFEEELGFQIFKRSSQGVVLTENGESLLKIAEVMVQQLDLVKALADPENEAACSNVHLAAVPVVCNSLIIDLINSLKATHPKININIQELRSCKILPALLSGSADIGIGSFSPSTKEQTLQDAAHSNFVIEPLFQDKMYAFLPRNHPLAHKHCITTEELKDDIPIHFNDFTLMDSYECWQPYEVYDEKTSKTHYSFTDRASIKKAVSKGLGYAFLPRLMALDDIYINTGSIFAVPLTDADVSLTLFLTYSSKTPLSKAEQAVLIAIRKIFADLRERVKEEDMKLTKRIVSTERSARIYY